MKNIMTTSFIVILLAFPVSSAPVKIGLDRIRTYREIFQGKRVGIIANHTSYNSSGRYIVDVFRGMTGVNVTALFSPEHGLYGQEQAGEKVDNLTDPIYHLPVHSLYGKARKPTREMLQDVDMLVFDIQDIGARFYTYIYTMSLAMEAAAENSKKFVVLDRPDAINGTTIEGSVLEPSQASFVGMYPIPVRYGMTIGELAKMFNGQGWLTGGIKADLLVIPLEGWRRSMWYDQTGLKFIKPSPNIPDIETAAVYPGLCLLEGTNVSEGRGTNRPFLQFGAPWIDSNRLADRLNNLNLPAMRFEPVRFTPTSSKYQGKECNGVSIKISNRDRLEPYSSGIQVVNEICRMYPNNFEWKISHFDRLCGTLKIRNAITKGTSLSELKNQWQVELETFRKTREKYLIYPD